MSDEPEKQDLPPEAGILRLSKRDAEAFLEALRRPPAPNARMRAAAKRFLRSQQSKPLGR
jgi:uncharacterized protein (DUF1778 family)